MRGESLLVTWELLRADLVRVSPRHGMPVLVLGAEHDAFLTPAQVRATARAYGTSARIYDTMAHAMMLEPAWKRVADDVIAWVGNLPGRLV